MQIWEKQFARQNLAQPDSKRLFLAKDYTLTGERAPAQLATRPVGARVPKEFGNPQTFRRDGRGRLARPFGSRRRLLPQAAESAGFAGNEPVFRQKFWIDIAFRQA